MTHLLWLAMTGLAGGATVGGHFQPTRIAFIALFVWQLARGQVGISATPVQRATLIAGGLLVGWGLVSLIWSPSPIRGAAEVLVVGLGVIMVISMVTAIRESPQAVHAMRRGWVCAFAVTLPVAAWEFVTNQHVAPGLVEFEMHGVPYAGVTYGNPNDYSTFIVFAFPFLLWSLFRTRRLPARIVYIFLVAAAAFIVAADGARLGLVALATEIIVLLVLRYTAGRGFIAQAGLVILLALTVAGAFRFQPAALTRVQALAEGLRGESTSVRMALALNGLELIGRTGGIGVGAGGFERAVLYSGDMLSTGRLGNPHNLWIEISAQYGILVGLSFVSWIVFLFTVLARPAAARSARLGSPDLAMGFPYGAALMAALAPAGLMSSSVLQYAMLWAAIGSAASLADAAYRSPQSGG